MTDSEVLDEKPLLTTKSHYFNTLNSEIKVNNSLLMLKEIAYNNGPVAVKPFQTGHYLQLNLSETQKKTHESRYYLQKMLT